jgi:signal peptidase I
MRIVLDMVRFTTTLIVAVLLAALLAGILPSLVGYESFVVPTSQMLPALDVNDLGVVKPVKVSELNVGDVVTYRVPEDPETVIVGRILDIAKDPVGHLQLQVRGDADPTTHQTTALPAAVLGRIAFSVPRVGLLVAFANGLAGKFALIGVPALLLALDWLRTRRQRRPGSALIETGWRALGAGYPELALKAADGVLANNAFDAAARDLRLAALKAREIQQCEHAAA